MTKIDVVLYMIHAIEIGRIDGSRCLLVGDENRCVSHQCSESVS